MSIRKMQTSNYQEDYRTRFYPLFVGFAKRIHALLEELIKSQGIPVAQVEHRAKSPESFAGKLARKAYRDPFSEVKDLAGVRVVTYYSDDVQRVANVIRREVAVDKDHSSDKLHELAVDEFGYRSFHLVCALQSPRDTLPEWQQFAGLAVEIQVRSVLQHAWAAISHKLDYKVASQAPTELRRQLFRLSALLELADEQFALLRDHSEQINAQYRRDVQRGDLDIPLNLGSLFQYTQERLDLTEWKTLGGSIGMREPVLSEYDKKVAAEHLLYNLQALGVETVAELDSLLKKHQPNAENVLREFLAHLKVHGGTFEAVGFDIINVLLTISERSRLPKAFEWPMYFFPPIRSTIRELTARSEGTADRNPLKST
jgi:putative GTP pyrophosphokinase